MGPDDLGWNDFHVAMVGATAALAGLVIVAASVNIATIVKATTITSRLAAAIAGLLLALTVAGVALVPGISVGWFGAATLAATLAAAAFQLHSTVTIVRDPSQAAHARSGKAALGWVPVLAYVVAAVFGLAGSIESALAAAAVGAITAIASAVVVSWVALIEVLR